MIRDSEYDERKVKNLIWFFWVIVSAIVVGGLVVAILTGTGKWVDRSGKLVVAASLILIFVQFRYEGYFFNSIKPNTLIDDEMQDKGVPQQESLAIAEQKVERSKEDFENMRRRLLLLSLGTAGTGEIIAAFGEVAYSCAELLFKR